MMEYKVANFTKTFPKSSKYSFSEKLTLSKTALKLQDIWTTFVRKFATKTFKKWSNILTLVFKGIGYVIFQKPKFLGFLVIE